MLGHSLLAALLIFSTLLGPAIHAEKKKKVYSRSGIADSRFGDDAKQELIEQAYQLPGIVSERLVGQELTALFISARLSQYIEGFGSRTAEPVATHLLGLPGTGKSVFVSILKSLGLNVVVIEAQSYMSGSSSDIGSNLQYELYRIHEEFESSPRPTVLLFDEVDKLPETSVNADGKEETHPLIGILNGILSAGKAPHPWNPLTPLDFSNFFVMTAMNLSSEDVEIISKKVCDGKPFSELDEADMEKIDQYLRSQGSDSAKFAILQRLFRINTVGRMVSDAITTKPLYGDDYDQLVTMQVSQTLERVSSEENEGREIIPSCTEAYERFLRKNAVYAPTGARKTVKVGDALTEQLISIGMRAKIPGHSATLTRPRRIKLDFDGEAALVKVTALKRKGTRTVVDKRITVRVPFDPVAGVFIPPTNLQFERPYVPSRETDDNERPPTQKEMRIARFGLKSQIDRAKLEAHLNDIIFGQESIVEVIAGATDDYLSRVGIQGEGEFTILAGFPGTGKTELVLETGAFLKIPVARISLRKYVSDEMSSRDSFVGDLMAEITRAKAASPTGKYILLLEEIDKLNELNPADPGFQRDPPALAIINELMDKGVSVATVQEGFSKKRIEINIRDAVTFLTMNFGFDTLGLSADPRMTSVDDVMREWEAIAGSPDTLKTILDSLFRPDTVDRILSASFHVVPPLSHSSYERILDREIENYVQDRFFDPETGRNVAGIKLKMSPSYKAFLYFQSLVPAQAGRQMVKSVRSLLRQDLNSALQGMPTGAWIADKPLVLQLDVSLRNDGSTRLRAVAKLDRRTYQRDYGKTPPEDVSTREVLLDEDAKLRFFTHELPEGALVEEARIQTAIHEFGHAFYTVRLGGRFEKATVVPLNKHVKGFVKFRPVSFKAGEYVSAQDLFARICSALASRAMERVIQSPDPRNALSTLDITPGAGGNILNATANLWEFIYELGHSPAGPTIERRGVEGLFRYAHFADLPAEKVEKIGHILRQLENEIVEDILRAHSEEWYKDRISHLARRATITEAEFYEDLAYVFPGENGKSYGTRSAIRRVFSDVVAPLPEQVRTAMEARQSETNSTAFENMGRMLSKFVASLKAIHPNQNEEFNESKVLAFFGIDPCADQLEGS